MNYLEAVQKLLLRVVINYPDTVGWPLHLCLKEQSGEEEKIFNKYIGFFRLGITIPNHSNHIDIRKGGGGGLPRAKMSRPPP